MINKADTIEDAEAFDRCYYANMTSSERLEIVQVLRESYHQLKKGPKSESGKGLRRVFHIIEQE